LVSTAAGGITDSKYKSFDLAPNGSMSFSTLAPPLSTYHVVLPCKGVFDGKTVEFGHVEQGRDRYRVTTPHRGSGPRRRRRRRGIHPLAVTNGDDIAAFTRRRPEWAAPTLDTGT
jgi:hypothetical protein